MLVVFSLWIAASGCNPVSQVEQDLYHLDQAIGARRTHRADALIHAIEQRHLTMHQACLLRLYRARYFRLAGQGRRAMDMLKQVKTQCGTQRDIAAWGLFELGLLVKDPADATRVFERVLLAYPNSAAAHPALFELLVAAKKAGIDLLPFLHKLYRLHPTAEMAPQVLSIAAGLASGRQRKSILLTLATHFPKQPLGAKAAFTLVKQVEARDPVGALEVLYKLAFGTDRSLLIGSYATGMEGPALWEAARVWDLYMNNPARAERDYRRFIRLHPTSRKCDDALYAVYRMYLRRGRKARAMQVLRELARRFPDMNRGMQAIDMLKKDGKE